MKKFPNKNKDQGFDRVASFYDAWARLVYGKSIRMAQCYFLQKVPIDAKVLIIGGGSGWILEELFERSNPASVLYVDASPEMLKLAKKRAEKASSWGQKVEFITANEEILSDKRDFDVVITAFFLDLFPEARLGKVFDILDKVLKSGGGWILTDFQVSEGAFRPIAKFLIWLMYLTFRTVAHIPAKRLPDFDLPFEQKGYLRQEKKTFFYKMIFSSWYHKP